MTNEELYWENYQAGFDKTAAGYLDNLVGKRTLADKLFMKKQNLFQRVLNKPKKVSAEKMIGIGAGALGSSSVGLALRNFMKKEPIIKKSIGPKSLKDFFEKNDLPGYYEYAAKNGFTQEDVDYALGFVKNKEG
jgi:hypothetical protein